MSRRSWLAGPVIHLGLGWKTACGRPVTFKTVWVENPARVSCKTCRASVQRSAEPTDAAKPSYPVSK